MAIATELSIVLLCNLLQVELLHYQFQKDVMVVANKYPQFWHIWTHWLNFHFRQFFAEYYIHKSPKLKNDLKTDKV